MVINFKFYIISQDICKLVWIYLLIKIKNKKISATFFIFCFFSKTFGWEHDATMFFDEQEDDGES